MRYLPVLLLLAALAFAIASAQPAAVRVDATAYGVTADSTVDNGPAITAAIAALCDSKSYAVPGEVLLPPGVIGYTAVSADPCNVTLVGHGGASLVAVAGSEIPRAVPSRSLGLPETRLRVLDTWAGDYAAGRAQPSRIALWPRFGPDGVTPMTYTNPVPGRTQWWPQHPVSEAGHAYAFGLRDVVLDGNEARAVAAFSPMPRDWQETNLRNGAAHAGITTGGIGGLLLCYTAPEIIYQIPQTGYTVFSTPHTPAAVVTLSGVVVAGYTAVGVLGDRCVRWDVTATRLGRSAYNHAAYNADGGLAYPTVQGPLNGWGGWRDVTVTADSWTSIVTAFGLHATALRVEPGTPNPFGRAGPEVINPRGIDVRIDGLAFEPSAAGAGTLALANGPVTLDHLPAGYTPSRPLWTGTGPVDAPPVIRHWYRLDSRGVCRDERGRFARRVLCPPPALEGARRLPPVAPQR